MMRKSAFVFAVALGCSALACSGKDPGGSPGATNGEDDAGAGTVPGADPSTVDAGASVDNGAGVDSGTPGPVKKGPPYPLVFVHGMAGFDKLSVGPIDIPYWTGIVEDLKKHRESAFVTITPPFDDSETRAAALAKQIDDILEETGAAKVNIIAHSQGGLDSRVLVSPAGLGYGSKVATISMISTPNRGSRVADAILGLLSGVSDSVIDDLTGSVLDLFQESFYDIDSDPHLRAQLTALSESYMTKTFNPKFVDAPEVQYFSYAGRSNLRSGEEACKGALIPNDPDDTDPTSALLVPMAIFLEDGISKPIVNDGLVTVASARWGTFVQCVAADHLKEVGLIGSSIATFDHVGFVRSIVQRVRATGN